MAIYTGKSININMELMGGPDLGAINQYLPRGYWVQLIGEALLYKREH